MVIVKMVHKDIDVILVREVFKLIIPIILGNRELRNRLKQRF